MYSLYSSFTEKEPPFSLLSLIETGKLDFKLHLYIRPPSLKMALRLSRMNICTGVATVRKLS